MWNFSSLTSSIFQVGFEKLKMEDDDDDLYGSLNYTSMDR